MVGKDKNVQSWDSDLFYKCYFIVEMDNLQTKI